MKNDIQSAEDNLAFIRAIVDETTLDYRTFGIVYMSAGLIFGLQCLIFAIHLSNITNLPEIILMLNGWVPTVLFLFIIFFYVWRDRKSPFGNSVTKRAINAAFSGAGIANLILALVFGWVAYQLKSWSVWVLFPIVVCALQGAIWYATSIIRRSLWMGVVAAGWYASAAMLGAFFSNIIAYHWGLTFALLLCMALPGYIMLRFGKPE